MLNRVRRSRFQTAVVQLILAATFSFPLSAATLADLAWLSGCWRAESDGRVNAEQWTKRNGNMMLGVSQTVVKGTTREFEFMRIMQEENGDVYLVATPSGQRETRFKLRETKATEAVFENAANDFPQRIIYRREGDSLLGRIEGVSKGKEKTVDFPLKRTPCD
jgi:hypothetical protein